MAIATNLTNATSLVDVHPQHHNDLASAVNALPSLYLPLTGGSLTGPLSLAADPSAPLQAATKQYADTKLTQAAADARYPLKTDADPYPIYLTQAEGDARYAAATGGAYLPLTGGTLGGSLLFSPDNTYDIGATTGSRPRSIYAAGSLNAGVPNSVGGVLNLNSPLDTSLATVRYDGNDLYLDNSGLTGLWIHWNGVVHIDNGILSVIRGITTAGSPALTVQGNQIFQADNTYDIGASAANRPRNVYVAGFEQIGPSGQTLTAGDLGVSRTAAPNTGAIFFGQSASPSHYLFFDQNNYIVANGGLDLYTTSGNAHAILASDAANTLAQRNGSNPQTFNLYNTYTDAANWEKLQLQGFSNTFYIQSYSTGTGVARDLVLRTAGASELYFGTSGTNRWRVVSTTGHFLAVADNTYDIGASGANRPRNVYVGGNIDAGVGSSNYIATNGYVQIGGWVQLYGVSGYALEQRLAGNPQTLRIYNTYTDASNYERLSLIWAGGNSYLQNEAAGTGVMRDMRINANQLYFRTQGVDRWQVSGPGNLLAFTDNTYDIGQSGASRPRHIYAAGNVIAGGQLQAQFFQSSINSGVLFFGNGVPAAASGGDGDFYLRKDTPAVANQRIYVKSAGAWVGIV